jgi:hypothetical protein
VLNRLDISGATVYAFSLYRLDCTRGFRTKYQKRRTRQVTSGASGTGLCAFRQIGYSYTSTVLMCGCGFMPRYFRAAAISSLAATPLTF